MIYKVLAGLAIAVIVYIVWKFFHKKEKFTMKLYRPGGGAKIPTDEWDHASILTSVLPGPVLAVEKGNYRRFVYEDKTVNKMPY